MPDKSAYERAIEFGLCPVPVNPGTKRPLVKWSHLQTATPTQAEIDAWVANHPDAWFGIVCGEASGNLEVLDFDIPRKGEPGVERIPPAYQPWQRLLIENGYSNLLDRLTLVIETVSGGVHVYYRREGGAKTNTKLASDADGHVLIETRGHGGFVVAPKSKGYKKVSGSLSKIPVLSSDEADALWAAASLLDQTPQVEDHAYSNQRSAMNGSGTPLDDFNARGSWSDALPGWTFLGRMYQGRELILRPGKKHGWSGVRGEYANGERVWIYTQTSGPLPSNRLLSKAACYAYSNHNGDFKAAAKALAALGYGEPAKTRSQKKKAQEPEPAEDGFPHILANDRQLNEVTDDALAALSAANDPPTIFSRDRLFVRLNRDDKGELYVREIDKHAMRESLGRAAHWWRRSKDGPSQCFPPVEIAENLLSLQSVPKGFPRLAGLSKAPIMREDGSVFLGPGYDEHSGWMVDSCEEWPEFDGDGEAAAKWVLAELFGDFPFVDGASKANALGLFILPFVRTAIDGPTPLFFGDAPRARSGKTKMLQCALVAGLGEVCDTMSVPFKEEEVEKKLHTYITEGRQVIFFDNLRHELKSASLEGVLTARKWRGRTLGTSHSSGAPVNAIFCLTANNGRMSADLAGRAVWIRIDPQVEDPTEREGFRHPDLEGWAVANRKQLVAAAIAMVRHWSAKGKPEGKKTKASYVQWSRIVGGILEACGIEGFLQNDKALKSAVNDEEETWLPFYSEWAEQFGWDPVTTHSLVKMAVEKDLLGSVVATAKSEKGIQTAIGRAINARVDMVYHGAAIRKSTMSKGYSRFKLEPVGGLVDSLLCGSYEGKKLDNAHIEDALPHMGRSGISPPVHHPGSKSGGHGGLSPIEDDDELLSDAKRLPDGSYVWTEGDDD